MYIYKDDSHTKTFYNSLAQLDSFLTNKKTNTFRNVLIHLIFVVFSTVFYLHVFYVLIFSLLLLCCILVYFILLSLGTFSFHVLYWFLFFDLFSSSSLSNFLRLFLFAFLLFKFFYLSYLFLFLHVFFQLFLFLQFDSSFLHNLFSVSFFAIFSFFYAFFFIGCRCLCFPSRFVYTFFFYVIIFFIHCLFIIYQSIVFTFSNSVFNSKHQNFIFLFYFLFNYF